MKKPIIYLLTFLVVYIGALYLLRGTTSIDILQIDALQAKNAQEIALENMPDSTPITPEQTQIETDSEQMQSTQTAIDLAPATTLLPVPLLTPAPRKKPVDEALSEAAHPQVAQAQTGGNNDILNGDNNIPTAPQKPQNTPVLPPQSTTQLATATTLINQGEIPPAAQFVDTAAVEKPATHSTETVNTAPTPQTQTQPQTQPVQLRVAAKKIIPNTLSEEEALEKIKVNPVFIEEEEADPNNMIVIHDESAAKKPKTKKKSQPKSKPDPLKQASLVDIETLDMQGFLDIRYATSDNFLGQKLYAKAKCYLRPSAAEALVQAAKYALEDENPFYLCINDCYRPLSVQEKMWQIMPKPGFVANPSKRPSNHNRAMAVDITPCDKQGRSLLMPTEFDAFSPLAAAQASDPSIPAEAIVNRENLQRIMLRSGFTPLRTEWWHFDYGNPKDYSVLNVPL